MSTITTLSGDHYIEHIVRRHGLPTDESQLRNMLMLAYTRGTVDGVLDGQKVIDRVMEKMRRHP